MIKDEIYEYWFACVKGISSKKKRIIYEDIGCAEGIYQMAAGRKAGEKGNVFGLSEKEWGNLVNARGSIDIEKEYEKAMEKGVRFTTVFQEEYPKRMLDQEGMPYALFYQGELPKDEVPSVAIVGARNCTYYGESKAIAFAEMLASCGVQIVSGMAHGIDGAAQRAAIRAGGKTFAVLGSGVDVCYPKENKGLYEDVKIHGGLITEQPMGIPPKREHFPARNRIISALADCILVMEAKEKSGSLITADMGLEQGKDVYALPGPIDSELSKGCHNLIAQGSGILISPERFIIDKGYEKCRFIEQNYLKNGKNKKTLESIDEVVYSCFGLFPKNIHAVINETGMKPEEVMKRVMSLELMGMIKEVTKNYYVKT